MAAPTRIITLNPPIERFGVRVDLKVHWNGEMLLVVDHFDDAIADVAVYKVATNGSTIFIGQSEPLGKDDSGSADIDERTGDVILAVSEATPGGGGASSGVRRLYIWSGWFPPRPQITATDQTARDSAEVARSLAQSAKEVADAILQVLKGVCGI